MCFQTYLVSVVERRETRDIDLWRRQSLFPNPENRRRIRRQGLAPALSITPEHYAQRVWLAVPLPERRSRRQKVGVEDHRQVNRKRNDP